MIKQKTIISPISCYGIGIHSGNTTQLTLKPALDNTGIVFIRTDVTSVDNKIPVTYNNVTETTLSTTVSNDAKVKVSTIEHLMAAIWGCAVDNMIVEVDGPEVPIMDGSSKPFVFMIECAGLVDLSSPRLYMEMLKEVKVIEKDSEIFVTPDDHLSIDLTIDFTTKAIGRQSLSFNERESFKTTISDSRTFGFMHELTYLRSVGLGRGVSLENSIGIEHDKVLNQEGLRYEDEFVRHKMLDLIGDLATNNASILAKINGYKTGHFINNQILRKIFSDPYSYRLISR